MCAIGIALPHNAKWQTSCLSGRVGVHVMHLGGYCCPRGMGPWEDGCPGLLSPPPPPDACAPNDAPARSAHHLPQTANGIDCSCTRTPQLLTELEAVCQAGAALPCAHRTHSCLPMGAGEGFPWMHRATGCWRGGTSHDEMLQLAGGCIGGHGEHVDVPMQAGRQAPPAPGTDTHVKKVKWFVGVG